MGIIQTWARRCGGEPVNRLSFVMPGPGHSDKDRSLSVTLSPNAPGGFRCHSFAGDDFKDCRDHVASLLGMPLFEPARTRLPVHRDKPAAKEVKQDTADLAALLWRKAVPIKGTLGEEYLRKNRGLRCPLPPTMRFLAPRGQHPATVLTAFAVPNEPEPEAMDMDGVEVRGVHLIRLAPDATKTEKRMLGGVAGLPLAMAPWTETGRGLVIAEGPEDALSGHEATGLAAWAGGSAGHMAKLAPMVPGWVESITIIEDSNDAGRTATRTLAEALGARGFEVIVMEGADRG